MAKQLELDLNDPKHPIYIAAKKLLDCADQIKDLKEQKGHLADQLVEVMQFHGKYSITINGVTLLHKKREPSTGIVIQRPT